MIVLALGRVDRAGRAGEVMVGVVVRMAGSAVAVARMGGGQQQLEGIGGRPTARGCGCRRTFVFIAIIITAATTSTAASVVVPILLLAVLSAVAAALAADTNILGILVAVGWSSTTAGAAMQVGEHPPAAEQSIQATAAIQGGTRKGGGIGFGLLGEGQGRVRVGPRPEPHGLRGAK